jgi:phosphoribosyl 1,2-cyclic phosphate phosphodiesterase
VTLAARVSVLGTGTSHGVPMIGCACATCRSTDPRDQRLRTSIYLDVLGVAKVLVDTSPDLRQQALRHQIAQVDAVLFTHSHADHVLGFDELRRFNAVTRGAVPCYADAPTWEALRRTFAYAFDGREREGGGVPRVVAHEITGPFDIKGVPVTPVPLLHGTQPILGFRFGRFAYVTDASEIPAHSWPLLEDLDVLIINALRRRSHPTHFSVSEALDAIGRLQPRHAYFTHMCHEIAHAETSSQLPEGVELAYDGLTFEVDVATP